MKLRIPLAIVVAGLLTGVAAEAQQASANGALITRLGNDTLAVERFNRTVDGIRAEVVLRSPRTSLTVYHLRMDDRGQPLRLESTTHDPAGGPSSPVLGRSVVHFAADSLRIETVGGPNAGIVSVAGGQDVLPFIDMVHWPFELMLQRAHSSPTDSVIAPLLAGRRVLPFVITRAAPAEYVVRHPFRGTMDVRVDEAGRLLHLDAGNTTRAVIVERAADVDIAGLAREFAARDAQGRPFGDLSGRGEADATIGEARINVDFGQPSKRGRDIFGALVPWGQVWRTGANRATHFSTDRDIVIGSTRVPAGTYTLFSIPNADGWTLIVNRQTNINGMAYNAEHDLAHIPMQRRMLSEVVEDFTIAVDPADDGGVLRITWDRTEAYVPIRVGSAR
jgi:hypothetical protein